MVSKVLVVATGVLVACQPQAAQPLPPTPTVALQAAPAPIDEAGIKSRTHDLFDAIDRADAIAFQGLVGPTFLRFAFGRFYDAARIGKGLAARADAHDPIHSRTWKDEHVYIGANEAVFIGESVEHVPAHGDHAAADLDGWDTVVWVREGDVKAASWQWSPAGADAEKEAWDLTFKQADFFNLKPNQTLIDAVKGKKPGTALDIAMGQGRNAVFLATQGWKVTGVDISTEGIKQAKDAAAKQKVKLDAVEADIDTYDLGKDKWDLVTLIYAGDDPKLLERIKPSIKKGGLFVVEFFAKEATAGTGIGGFEAGELAKAFAGWKITRDEIVEDVADWGLRKTKVARFVAERP